MHRIRKCLAGLVVLLIGFGFNVCCAIIIRASIRASILLGNRLLNDARNAAPQDSGTQLRIQAQVAAVLNSHVIETPANWYNRNAFYPTVSLANGHAKCWHDSDIPCDLLVYGFSYDDMGDHSPSPYTAMATTVTNSNGW